MNNRLIIIGASGHGKVVADIAFNLNRWEEVNFLDDNESLKESMGVRIIGKSTDAFKCIDDSDIFVAIGNNSIREKFIEELEILGANIPILIHPNAVIGKGVEIGSGTVVMAGSVINCCTVIGKGCIINTGAVVEHDNVIENFVHISPGVHLAGTVKVGKGTWIGIGSTVCNNISITNGCTVGAGSLVVNDITENGVYVGAPVRKIK